MMKKEGRFLKAVFLAAAVFLSAAVMPSFSFAEENNSLFEIKPLYVFQNKGSRDPFIPRYKTGVFPSALTVDISTFSLLGITESRGEKAALFKSKSGVQLGYVFMNGKLMAENDVNVSDVAGEFRGSMEILLRQGDKEVLFKLAKQPTTSPNIRPDDIETGKQIPGEY